MNILLSLLSALITLLVKATFIMEKMDSKLKPFLRIPVLT